jgi:hypothetical protein
MSEETKKVEQTEPDAKASEVSEQDLEELAGGAPGDPIQGIDVSVGRKPKKQSSI